MSNYLKTFFSLLSAILLIGANPIPKQTDLEEIIKDLKFLMDTFDKEGSCYNLFIPKISLLQNITVAEVSCMAIYSLKTLSINNTNNSSSNPSINDLTDLNEKCRKNAKEERSLQRIYESLFYISHNNLSCKVNYDEEQDLNSTLKDIRAYFQLKSAVLVV